MENHKKLYSILNSLIDISENQQQKYREHMHIGSLNWAKEFCTIHVRTARQSGHTYAVIQTASKRFSKSIIISPKLMMSNHIKKEIRKQKLKEENIILSSIFALDNLRGLDKVDAVFVDCSFMLSKNKKEDIYNTCLYMKKEDKPFFFIFVE